MIMKPTRQHTQIEIDVRLTHVQCNMKGLNDNISLLIYRR